ncbi:MAG: VCBS repeat-containing protein, partial [Ignavibacteriae bacterium]|nr:VCBS repeat-containing protein [Ignavibacteriota bacterium]
MFTQTMKRVLQLSCTVVLSSYIFLYVAVAQDEQEKYFPLLTRKEGVRTFVPQPIPQTSPNQIQQKITDVVYDDTTTFSRIDIGLKGVFTGDALWFDYDNDGDLDAIVAGWDDTSYITTIYNNQAGAFIDIGADIEGIGTERGLSWGDYDRDGDIDFAITGRTDTMALNPVSRIYRNENGQFTDIRANLMQLNGGSVAWADYDRDGDLDLFLSGSPDIGRTFYSLLYRNDAPYRSEKDTFTNVNAGFPGVWGSFVDWGDYDNDDDLDLLLTGYGDLGQTVLVFRNDGKEGFHNANINLPRMNSGMVSWADYDNDKDLDIALAGCISSGALSKIFRNDGNDIFIDIGAQLKPLCHSAVAWGDYDSDGDLDLAMSGGERYWYGTNPTTKLYRNDSGTFVDTDIRLKGTWYGSLTWGDVDNDGALDLLVTGGTIPMPYYYYHGPYYPITYLYQNKYPRKNTRPETPGSSNVSIDNDRVSLTWSTANDGETPSNALTYNLRIGTTPGGTDIVAPSSNVQTGFRR